MWRRVRKLFGSSVRADVQDELRFHMEAMIQDLVSQGWQPDAARREAKRKFGSIEDVQRMGEQMAEERETGRQRSDYLEAWAQDVRYAFRTLRKDRGFATVAICILALGIAANTAVFSVVNTVLLRPLPFPNADQLTWLASGRGFSKAMREAIGLSGVTYTVDVYEEYQRHNESFQSLTSYNPFFGNSEYTLTGRGEAQPVVGVMVAENFFETLGVQPEAGRFFLKEECQKGGPPAVLLSYPFWQRQFAGDPGIIGQAVTLSKTPVTVVGVLPQSFDFGAVFSPGMKVDVYTPLSMDVVRNWGNTLALVGRLKPGVSVGQAQAEAEVVFQQIRKAHPTLEMDYTPTISGLKEFVSGKLRRSLIVLWSAVGMILLIVCVNLSNLLLARTAARGKEFAIRGALGAGRARLLRQLLTESLVLSAVGGMLGLGLAYVLTRWLAHQGSIALPLLSSVSVDGAALAWTLAITAGSAVLFGLAPGFRMGGANLQDTLKDSGAGMSAGRKHERLRAALVISEVALACVLLVGAGLLLRSFLNVLDVDLGFEPSRAAAIKIDYDDQGKRPVRGAILQEMLRNVSAIPGVEAAGVTDMLPLGRNRSWGVQAKGVEYPKGAILAAVVRIVTPGYLEAMGMRLREGRTFTWQDGPAGPKGMIINEAAARYFWRGQDPLGRIAYMNGETKVIGVIADVKEHGLEGAAGPEMYLPVTQEDPEGAELVVRSRLSPEVLGPSIKRVLRSLNPNQPASELRPLQQIVDRSVSPRRFFVMLVASFAALGLVLASLGIYGVVSYTVTRQTQEIGIRMALGASAPQVQRGVIARTLRLAAAGVAIGIVGAFAAAKWIASLLFGTGPADPATFASIIVLLCAVAFLAGYIPARRASRIDPMIALRGL